MLITRSWLRDLDLAGDEVINASGIGDLPALIDLRAGFPLT
jgi:hypothetical protein